MPNKIVRITVITDCRATSVGEMTAGGDYDVPEKEAQKLIDRGFAKPYEMAKVAKVVKKATQETVNSYSDAD